MPYQRGTNLFQGYGKRFGIPIFKFLPNTRKNIIKDIVMGEKPREAIINNLKRKATETIENIADRMNQSDSYIRKREKSNSNKIIKTKKKNHYREKIN